MKEKKDQFIAQYINKEVIYDYVWVLKTID